MANSAFHSQEKKIDHAMCDAYRLSIAKARKERKAGRRMQSQDYLNSTASAWQAWCRNALKENKQTIISVGVGLLVVVVAWKYFYKTMSNNGEKGEPDEGNDKTRSEKSTSSKTKETSKCKRSIAENGESRENSESEENLNDDEEFLIGKGERKIKVIIRRGDITREEVNVIVNAANGRLQHGGGVARAIAVKAGIGIDKEGKDKLKQRGSALNVSEVLHTYGYDLKATYVLHAVGPIRGRDSHFHSLLEETFKNCLKYADEELEAKSIALPLISSGIFGGQKKECADALFEAVNKFVENETFKNVEEIRLVNIDAEATDAIKASFSKSKAGQSAS
ncbi:uncharacterized protein TM_0508-like [Anneissia japonica]|uniref:uncharacterized protein TM_0508-like n=1 Tax=Anneissia japonica TaxID=1529436 RepID=UPI0014254D7B|nr:uncharacterized protein TM_0508-like [Anneissia japonica]